MPNEISNRPPQRRMPRIASARRAPPDDICVRTIRERLGMSQWVFAAAFGFSHASVRNWETGRRRPEAAARVLLSVIDLEPEAVRRVLEQGGRARPSPAEGA